MEGYHMALQHVWSYIKDLKQTKILSLLGKLIKHKPLTLHVLHALSFTDCCVEVFLSMDWSIVKFLIAQFDIDQNMEQFFSAYH